MATGARPKERGVLLRERIHRPVELGATTAVSGSYLRILTCTLIGGSTNRVDLRSFFRPAAHAESLVSIIRLSHFLFQNARWFTPWCRLHGTIYRSSFFSSVAASSVFSSSFGLDTSSYFSFAAFSPSLILPHVASAKDLA